MVGLSAHRVRGVFAPAALVSIALAAGCGPVAQPSVQPAPRATGPTVSSAPAPVRDDAPTLPTRVARETRGPRESETPTAAPAPADGPAVLPFALPDLKFRSAKGKLIAVAGALRTVVPSVYHATSVVGWKAGVEGESVIVTYRDEYSCADPQEKYEVTLALAPLAARMLNAQALAAHRAGDYPRAASGFTAALVLDPELALARGNLACALARQGERREAIQALAPLIAQNPVLAYSKVATDPDLADLRGEPEITTLEASPRTQVELGVAPPASNVPLVGAAGRAVALRLHETSWGSMAFQVQLVVLDSGTGRELLRVTLVDWNDSDPEAEGQGILPARRAAVQSRFAQVNAWLGALGFAPDPGARSFDAQALRRGVALPGGLRVRSGKEGIGLHVLDGPHEVASAAGVLLRDETEAVYLPSVHALALLWDMEAPEGCDVGDTVFGELLPLPQR